LDGCQHADTASFLSGNEIGNGMERDGIDLPSEAMHVNGALQCPSRAGF
jgi:hypothetical protein